LEAQFGTPEEAPVLFVRLALPLIAIRSIAEIIRSVLVGAPLPGIVIGLSSFAMLAGVWYATSLVLPALARQFKTDLKEHHAFVLVTFALIPFWLAGGLRVLAEAPQLVVWWSRAIAALASLYGVVIAQRGMSLLDLPKGMRTPFLVASLVCFLVIYGVLSVFFGISSHIILIVIG